VEKGLDSSKIEDLSFWLAIAFIQHANFKTAHKALKNRIRLIEESCELLEKQRQQYTNKIPFNWYALIVNGLEHMQLEINHIQTLIEKLDNAVK